MSYYNMIDNFNILTFLLFLDFKFNRLQIQSMRNRYPAPQTVSINCVLSLFCPSLSLSLLMCTVTVAVSPRESIPHTRSNRVSFENTRFGFSARNSSSSNSLLTSTISSLSRYTLLDWGRIVKLLYDISVSCTCSLTLQSGWRSVSSQNQSHHLLWSCPPAYRYLSDLNKSHIHFW